MQIAVNGTLKTIAKPCSVEMLIKELSLQNQRVAVEINGDIVPKSNHNKHILNEGDKVEIVHAVGGG